MKFEIWRDCITNDAYTILFSKREGGMVFNFQQNNILYRITTIEVKERQQLVLPAAHIPTVLQALHDDMGHPGKDRTLSLLRFYWPGMYKDTESWIEQCRRCLRRKTPTNQRAPTRW
jgi:hypothetical protein